VPEVLAATRSDLSSYALGWDVAEYHGARLVSHTGAVLGFLTVVALLPEKRVGFSIEINSEDGEVIRGLMYELLDHYLGLPRTDWSARFRAEKKRRVDEALETLRKTRATPAHSGPSLPLSGYAGIYRDAWYGDIAVAETDGKLTIDFKSTPRMRGALEHWQYDTFVTRFEDASIEPAYVTFVLDAEGNATRMGLKAVSPIADFSYDYPDLSPLKQAGAPPR